MVRYKKSGALVLILLLASGLLLTTGCGTGKPTRTARAYFEALSAKDFETAQGYIAIQSYGTFDSLQRVLQPADDYTIKRYTIDKEGRATVYYMEEGSKEVYKLYLIRERGGWKVVLNELEK